MHQLSLWADELRDISALGLKYSQNIYNKERYQKIQDIAMEMLALATDTLPNNLEPLREPIFSRPSPLIGGDAAVIDDNGKILLIKRSDNQMWAMPGGLFEVGETPVEGVVREVFEETGVKSRVVKLVGVFDSRLCGFNYPLHFYSINFLCKPTNKEKSSALTHKQEVLDIKWFNIEDLPDNIDLGHISRIPEAIRIWKGDNKAYFDQ